MTNPSASAAIALEAANSEIYNQSVGMVGFQGRGSKGSRSSINGSFHSSKLGSPQEEIAMQITNVPDSKNLCTSAFYFFC